MKTTKPDKFPNIITKGSASVKICRTVNRGEPLLTASFIAASGRVLRQFRNLDDAKREAASRASSLALGDMEALRLTGRDRQLCVAASARRLAVMNLTLGGITADFGPEPSDTFLRDFSFN
jgi:seryl-tRNA(Sec) selenium transferase